MSAIVVDDALLTRAVVAYQALWDMADPSPSGNGKAFELRFVDPLDGAVWAYRVVITKGGREYEGTAFSIAWNGVIQPYAFHVLVMQMERAVEEFRWVPVLNWTCRLPGVDEPKQASVMANVLARGIK